MKVRSRPVAVLALTAALCVTPAGPAHATAAADQPRRDTTSPRDNALTAMKGEAFAYAKYLAFAGQARRDGQRGVARLFTSTARTELHEHFAEIARHIGFVGDNAQNLRESITGEDYESTVMYPGYARQATADGCAEAAELFSEIARDEHKHAGWFRQALATLTYPGSHATIPVGEAVTPVPIPKRMPACSGQTQTNLLAALHGEGLAGGKYLLYAERAERSGVPRLGRLFRSAAQSELTEHFAEEATLAGLVGSNRANLEESIEGEATEATETYPAFARQAFEHGDLSGATLYLEIADDEIRHAGAFQRAVRRLGAAARAARAGRCTTSKDRLASNERGTGERRGVSRTRMKVR